MAFTQTLRRAFILSLPAILLSFAWMPNSVQAQENERIYDFETALLKFDEEGSHSSTKRTVHIADWGRLQRDDEDKSLFGEKYTITTIYHGDTAYRIDWKDKAMKKYKADERKPVTIGLIKLAESLGDEKAAMQQLLDKGVDVLPVEPLLGYFCESWKESQGKLITTYWAYRGIVLKKIVKERLVDDVDYRERVLAKKAQFNVYIDKELFELPKDFKESTVDKSEVVTPIKETPAIRIP